MKTAIMRSQDSISINVILQVMLTLSMVQVLPYLKTVILLQDIQNTNQTDAIQPEEHMLPHLTDMYLTTAVSLQKKA